MTPEEKPQANERGKTGSTPVFVYLAILFAAAFLLLLMAYLMQEHKSSTVIADLQETLNLSRDALTEENRTLRAEVENLLSQVEQLQDQLDTAESRYLTLQESSLRAARIHTAVRLLEQLEYLCRQEQLEEARTVLARSEHIGEWLAQGDQIISPDDVVLVAGQPTLTQRLEAVTALLAEEPS